VTVVCVVTDIIIECMKIYLLLFCFTLYLYLSTVQFTLYINQLFIECYVYLYLSLIYIILFSVPMCCHGDDCPCYIVARVTCPLSLALFVNLYASFVSFVSHCASMSTFEITHRHLVTIINCKPKMLTELI